MAINWQVATAVTIGPVILRGGLTVDELSVFAITLAGEPLRCQVSTDVDLLAEVE